MSFTATGDDGSSGTATSYDVRCSTSLLTEGNWAGAVQMTGEPVTPKAPGQGESFAVGGAAADTTYYVGLKVEDEVGNRSGLSNVVSIKTVDGTAPGAVTNLSAVVTAHGDNGASGTAASHEVKYRTDHAIANQGDWDTGVALTSGVPAPAVAGTVQSMTVPFTSLGSPAKDTTIHFAIRAKDEANLQGDVSNSPNVTAP